MSGITILNAHHTAASIADLVEEFFLSFEYDDTYYYENQISKMVANNERSINLNFTHLAEDSLGLNLFRADHEEFLECCDNALLKCAKEIDPDYDMNPKVRIVNYPHEIQLRKINSDYTGKFVSISGMVTSFSLPNSIAKKAVFVCEAGHEITREAGRDYVLRVPKRCDQIDCKSRNLEQSYNDSTFTDYQVLHLQEHQNETPDGKLPMVIDVFITGDMVNYANMGETVKICGTIRPELSRVISLGKEIQTYRHRLYCNGIEMENREMEHKITQEEKAYIEELFRKNNEEEITKIIVNAFAGKIHGHELLKEASLLCVIGSDRVLHPNGSMERGDLNMLIVGDPGQAKSELGKIISNLSPKAFYVSGRGSSGAGLTVGTFKENDIFMLKPGATVLADNGVAVIDEFDKMSPLDRSALHEVMEQQTASISKGGVTATLNARCSVIAIANPMMGNYSNDKTLKENIPSVPIPLLTRFDMIFVVRDNQDNDEKLAKYIMDGSGAKQDNLISYDLLKKFIKLAKSYHPVLTEEAGNMIAAEYCARRGAVIEGDIQVTPRHLLAIKRLAIARAKMMMHKKVTRQDTQHAIKLMDESLRTYAIDPDTGETDYGNTGGRSKKDINQDNMFMDLFGKMADNNTKLVKEKELIAEMINSEKWKTEEDARKYVKKMHEKAGVIIEERPGSYRRTN